MVIVMGVLTTVFVMCSICFVSGVHASVVNDSGDLTSELGAIKNTMKVLSDQWEKWNTLFITSLEPRITSTASTLSSIDSNIHNLQERAHVWDTFQLHVTAWNDQLSSLDRKMDILSKGMEKLLVIDNKLNTMLSVDYKIDNLIKKVNTLDESIVNVDNLVKNKHFCKSPRDSLFEEFATRGILSSLKLVERKVDRLLIFRQNNVNSNDQKQKFSLKCNIPKLTDDLLNDISSKVDIIFDSVNKKIDTDYGDEYLDVKDNEGSGDLETVPLNPEKPNFIKRGANLLQNNDFCKAVIQNLKDLNMKTSNIQINTVELLQNQNQTSDKTNILLNKTFQACSKIDFRHILGTYLRNYSIDQTQNMNLILESYFNEYRAHIATMFEKFAKKKCADDKNIVALRPETTTKSEENTVTSDIVTKRFSEESTTNPDSGDSFENKNSKINFSSNKTCCEDLDNESISGLYVFRHAFEESKSEKFFNKKYCEIRDDGLWTVIQRRNNFSIQQDFNVSWIDYKVGFGDLEKDFWIGNNFLSKVSKSFNLTLRVELSDFDGNEVWAEYSTFKVGLEEDQFKLMVGGYIGNSSDSLSSHNGALFSTYDRKNDEAPDCCPCSVSYGGGWWFNRCFESNLNGLYYRNPYKNDYFRGIVWEHWLGNYSLKKSLMMVKSTGLVRFYSHGSYPNITRIDDP